MQYYAPKKQDLPLPENGIIVKYNKTGNKLYVVDNPSNLTVKKGDYGIVSYKPVGEKDNRLEFVVVQIVGVWNKEIQKILNHFGLYDEIVYHAEILKGFFKP